MCKLVESSGRDKPASARLSFLDGSVDWSSWWVLGRQVNLDGTSAYAGNQDVQLSRWPWGKLSVVTVTVWKDFGGQV